MASEVTRVENARPFIDAKAIGSVICIDVDDPDIEKVIAAGFDRLVIERSTDDVTFTEVTHSTERPALQPGVSAYRWADRAGSASYFYRVRYWSSSRDELTAASPSIAGIGLAIRSILTVQELKERYFFGIDLTNNDGSPLPDSVFEHYILAAIRWLEKQIDVPIIPSVRVEQHDFYRASWREYIMVQLDTYPVVSVERFQVTWPGAQPYEYPLQWLRIAAETGTLQVVPTTGTFMDISVGTRSQLVEGGIDYVPQVYEVEYTAGFEEGKIPRDIVDLIGMFAALGPFNVFGDLIAGAGIASISLSMDGLSQNIGTTSSATNSGYGARVGQYLKQVKQQIPALRRYYKRLGGMVVS